MSSRLKKHATHYTMRKYETPGVVEDRERQARMWGVTTFCGRGVRNGENGYEIWPPPQRNIRIACSPAKITCKHCSSHWRLRTALGWENGRKLFSTWRNE